MPKFISSFHIVCSWCVCHRLAGGPLAVPQYLAQQQSAPAFVIVGGSPTTGDESIQEEYAKLARDILPKYGARYLARSRRNLLLEGDGATPCCMALLAVPELDAVKQWYDSPENQAATKVRRGVPNPARGGRGLPPQK